MKSSTLLTLLTALAPSLTAAAAYTANFTGAGKLPKGMTTLNANDLRPVYTAYGAVFTIDGWTVDRFAGRFVAMSPTHTGSDDACENILSLPEMEIAPGESLIWSARSALADFPESYRVLVTDGDNTVEIAAIADEEASRWAYHTADLSQFAGKTVKIQFVATSVNRFMLMLASIKVAAPDAPEFFVTDTTPAYTADRGTAVTLEALNIGGVADGEIVCRIAGEEVGRESVSGWNTGESRTFSFEAPTPLNSRSRYSVTLETAGADPLEVAAGSYFSSYHPRTLLLDEGTGMWCVNCPAGMLQIQKMQQKFGSRVITLATHTTDVLANNGYFANLGMRSIPSLILNRVASSMGQTEANFEFLYDRPTPFGIEVWATQVEGDKAKISVGVTNAEGVDNAPDRYRVGYVLTATFYHPGDKVWDQSSSCTTPQYEQFYLLPGEIPSDLIKYHHTTMTSEGAFDGIPSSIPATLEPGKMYGCSWEIANPNSVLIPSLRDAEVVAYIIDTEDGHIENAVKVSLAEDMTGIEETVAAAAKSPVDIKCTGSTLRLTPASPTDCRLAIYDTAGRLLFSDARHLDSPVEIDTRLPRGIYIIKVDTPASHTAQKLLIAD